MSSTAELKKIKLNVTNIRSVLLDGKKAVDEKKKDMMRLKQILKKN